MNIDEVEEEIACSLADYWKHDIGEAGRQELSEFKELCRLAHLGQSLEALPKGAGISHGFSDITRDWISVWDLTDNLDDPMSFNKTAAEALKFFDNT